MKKSVILTIKGKVQGVGFRYSTVKAAESYGIKGFVKNKPDGSVYIEAEGNPQDTEEFIKWCRNGSSWSRVDQVNVQEGCIHNYSDFTIKY